jgi:hypothetical protein
MRFDQGTFEHSSFLMTDMHELAYGNEEHNAPSKEGVNTMSFYHRCAQVQNVHHVLTSVSHLVLEETQDGWFS